MAFASRLRRRFAVRAVFLPHHRRAIPVHPDHGTGRRRQLCGIPYSHHGQFHVRESFQFRGSSGALGQRGRTHLQSAHRCVFLIGGGAYFDAFGIPLHRRARSFGAAAFYDGGKKFMV